METYQISELKAGTIFTADLILDKNLLICPANCPISAEMIKALKEWNFDTLQSEGSIAKDKGTSSEKPQINKEDAKKIMSKTEDITDIIEKEEENEENARANPEILDAMEKARANNNDKSRMEVVQEIYDKYLKYIDNIYTHYATHKRFRQGEITQTIKELCIFIKENQRYVLRIMPTFEMRNKNFLVSHSMRTTVLAVTIGIQLKMPLTKLIELGIASVLHEIGMLRLPPALYMSDKPLTNTERNQILTHPVLSYNILKDANFPLNILLGVLDHHERENGTGYPRHIRGQNISLYAKIIAVACSFEAITAPRHFKEARTTYDAMIEMLKNPNKQYDDTVLRALLLSLSLYPIGAFVYLANGKIAQVTDVTPGNPKNPVVHVLGEKDANGNSLSLQTNDSDLKIVRVLNSNEVKDVLATMKKS